MSTYVDELRRDDNADELANQLRRRDERVRVLEDALRFYADHRRYCYDETCCLAHHDDSRAASEVEEGVLEDLGLRARYALDGVRPAACACVGQFGPNPDCGACGGDGCVEVPT